MRTESGAQDQAIERATAALETFFNGLLTTFGGGEVGADVCVANVDTDDRVASSGVHLAHGAANARSRTGNDVTSHGE